MHKYLVLAGETATSSEPEVAALGSPAFMVPHNVASVDVSEDVPSENTFDPTSKVGSSLISCPLRFTHSALFLLPGYLDYGTFCS